MRKRFQTTASESWLYKNRSGGRVTLWVRWRDMLHHSVMFVFIQYRSQSKFLSAVQRSAQLSRRVRENRVAASILLRTDSTDHPRRYSNYFRSHFSAQNSMEDGISLSSFLSVIQLGSFVVWSKLIQRPEGHKNAVICPKGDILRFSP